MSDDLFYEDDLEAQKLAAEAFEKHIREQKRRCKKCGWELPRWGCPAEFCNGVIDTRTGEFR